MDTTTEETLRQLMFHVNIASFRRPVYLFETEKFKENVKSLYEGFRTFFPKFIAGYSYKTNPADCIVTSAYELGMYAEVVSPEEYELALENGVETNHIIYNGIIPDVKGKYEVARAGGIVNIENYDEFVELLEYAEYHGNGEHINIGIRINLDLKNGRVSRFGIEPHSSEYDTIVKIASKSKILSIVGIHCHMYGARNLDGWHQRALEAGKIAKELGVEYIDFGSNMYGRMDPRLKLQFDDYIPSFYEYAEEVYNGLKQSYRDEELPTVIVEPGTPVVADTVSLLAKVVNIRTVRGKTFATTNVSIYDLGFLPMTKDVPVDVLHNSRGSEYEDLDVYGYTCTEGDKVCKGFNGKLAKDDFMLFRNVGAYSNAVANDFIKGKFDVITI